MDNRTRILYEGDNIYFLQSMESESVDLIATDPPYNKNKKFQGVGASAGQELDDTWTWTEETYRDLLQQLDAEGYGSLCKMIDAIYYVHSPSMAAFITFMSARAIHFHRLLKPTGSLYLQCDSTASAYLKAMLDSIFGNGENGKPGFRNEIIWKRQTSNNSVTKNYGNVVDCLLFYTKCDKYTWNQQYHTRSNAELKMYKQDSDGRWYKTENLTAPSGSLARQFVWRGTELSEGRAWRYSLEHLEELWHLGLIQADKQGRPLKRGHIQYLDEMPDGSKLQNLWTDIRRVGNMSKERTGWATQKPIALYRRIIETSSNECDLVLDPFCGSGTTCVAAEQLGRSWIGIDISPKTGSIVLNRLENECNNLFGGDVIFATSVDNWRCTDI